MKPKVISESKIVWCKEHSLFFERDFGGGLSFPCDERGHVVFDRPELMGRYREAIGCFMRGEMNVSIQTCEWHYVEPAVLRCACGKHVCLDYHTCGCDCGRFYNMSGQPILPPCMWEPEDREMLLAGPAW